MKQAQNAIFASHVLGWRLRGVRLVPNTADVSSVASERIAGRILDLLGVARELRPGIPDASSGRPLEINVAETLELDLALMAPTRGLVVHLEPRSITDFAQYEHLKRVDELAKRSPELRVTLGTDYLIKPDVVVSLPGRDGDKLPLLHAVISCKWTIRSDRVQNIRHEYNLMIRHRRERLPHLVTVTAEPLPTRLASIARGTGEVDATYHIAFGAMHEAVISLRKEGLIGVDQIDAWSEIVDQGRIKPYSELAPTLAGW